ncbi:MAG: mechanosensitive ion channel family protein [Clostridiales bacterium]|jgi:small conductance mechanosensitive channel|nr:mechanosensitive ion channel family protein [Clostridiales bacterium]
MPGGWIGSVLSAVSSTVSDVASSAPDNVITETVAEVATFWTKIWDWFVEFWPKMLWAAIIFVGGWWLSSIIVRLLRNGLKKTDIERSVVTFLCSISKYFLRFVVIVFALTPFGFQISSVFAALGAAGIGLGLGLKESVSNLASGIQVIVTKPLKVGDYVAIDAVEGTVLRVEMMFTTLKTLDNKEVVIPNSKLTASILTNYTSLGVRRADFNYSVRYGTDIERLREAMLAEAMADDLVLKEPKPIVAILDQGANGIDISMRLFCTPENYWTLFFRMQETMKVLFEREKIQIPFNQMDIHIREDDTSSLSLPQLESSTTPEFQESTSASKPSPSMTPEMESLQILAQTVAEAAAKAAAESAVKAAVEAHLAMQQTKREPDSSSQSKET